MMGCGDGVKTSKTTNPKGKKDVGLPAPEVSIIPCAWSERPLSDFFNLEGCQSSFAFEVWDADEPLWPGQVPWQTCANGMCGQRYNFPEGGRKKWFTKFWTKIRKDSICNARSVHGRILIWTNDISPSGVWRCSLKTYTLMGCTWDHKKWYKILVKNSENLIKIIL